MVRIGGRGVRAFVVPSPNMDVAVGPEGELWVANPVCHRLESYKSDGTLSRYWGSPVGGVAGFFGCCGPSDFAILPDGAFITSEKSIARIKRHHADGRLDVLVADPRTFGEASSGIELAVTPSGQILALERGMRTVRVLEPLLPGKEADHVTRVD